MVHHINTIQLQMPYHLGGVNCYLIETSAGFILVDSGSSNQRDTLLKELERCGCGPGKLKLVVITHGDFDHTGNAAFLRRQFGARIAMHTGDLGMAERGDMFWNRKKGNALIRFLAPRLFRFNLSDRFTPDLLINEEFDLSEYGVDGQVLYLPGHSQGSLGLWLAVQDPVLGSGYALFCGDLLDHTKDPALNSIMDDPSTARASLDKLNHLTIDTVYPGHGAPWKWTPLQVV